MKYSTAVIIFGLISSGLAPIVIHKIKNPNIAIGCLVVLAMFASFPLKKLYGLDGFFLKALATLTYGGILYCVGFGWKRTWK